MVPLQVAFTLALDQAGVDNGTHNLFETFH